MTTFPSAMLHTIDLDYSLRSQRAQELLDKDVKDLATEIQALFTPAVLNQLVGSDLDLSFDVIGSCGQCRIEVDEEPEEGMDALKDLQTQIQSMASFIVSRIPQGGCFTIPFLLVSPEGTLARQTRSLTA